MTDSFANSISAYSTLAIAILTAAYVYVSTRTLRKIGRQAEIAEAQHLQMIRQEEYSRQQWRAMHEQGITMKEQFAEMERQTKAAENNAIAALDNAQTAQDSLNMFISKERARLRVELANVRDTPRYLLVPITLALSGVSEAEILDFRSACTAGSKEDLIPISAMLISWMPEDYPRVITPRDPRAELTRAAIPSATFKEEDASTIVAMLKTGALDVFCRGSILYQDIFGQKWRRNFSRMWTYGTVLGTLGGSGQWVDYGEQRDNEEKRSAE